MEGLTTSISKQQRAAIIDQVREIIAAEDGLSIGRLAPVLDMSRPVLSSILKGNYNGETDKYIRRMHDWLARRDAPGMMPTSGEVYVPTYISEMIITVCEMAMDSACIGLVKSPSGFGKTAALREFARRVGQAHCIYITAGEACTSKRDLIMELAIHLGVSLPPRATTGAIYRQVRDHLAAKYLGGKGGHCLVIIDEATTLAPSAINMLRNLNDEPTCRTAIVLGDTVARLDSFLYSRGEAVKGGNEQIRRRSTAQALFTPQQRISPKDVRAVADAFLASLGIRAKLGKQAYEYLTKLANKPGAFGNVTARLANLHYFAQRKGLESDWSAMQLDWIGGLSGQTCQYDHGKTIPFTASEAA